jgi:YfiH family protein
MHSSDPSYSPFFPAIPRYTTSNLIQQNKGPLRFCFPRLSGQKHLVHAVFSRKGGVSKAPFASLNVGLSTLDSPARVRENLRRIRESIGAQALLQVDQVHGDDVVFRKGDHGVPQDRPRPGDAQITNVTGRALLVKLADCQGVILHDPERNVIGVVHCGWRGSVQNILGKTVKRMEEEFSSRPGSIHAAIGPSLGPCCAEFQGHEQYFPESFRRFQVRENFFDLWAISCRQLMDAGIPEDHIEIAGACTRCRTDLFYSYRKEGKTGRFAVVAMLKA